jgi:protein-L-isoaspartate(D-aspartate) O-methyltransferase
MKRLLALSLPLCLLAAAAQDLYRQQREEMVREQIQERGIKSQEVLRAMQAIPRHEFVPAELRPYAYEDRPLPIGYDQTISQPYIVAFMSEAIDVDKSHRVLEIGTGSGYQAAVLASLAKHVYTIEIVPELAASARQKLFRFSNITVRGGDGYKGWPEEAPFDRIMLTAAPPELPKALLQQLRPGGKLLAPVGRSVFSQELVLVEKGSDGKLSQRAILPVRFVPMVPGK